MKNAKELSSLGDILDYAIAFEQQAFNFYTALQTKVSKRLRALVPELAEEEQHHLTLFQEVKNNPDIQHHIATMIRNPPSDHRFSDYIHVPELDDFPDDQSILQYALGREQVAMEQYTHLATQTPEGAIRDLFQFLAIEELAHKKELEKRYYELVHSGGV